MNGYNFYDVMNMTGISNRFSNLLPQNMNENSQQYTLDILWKQREPVELWEKLPEEIMLIIFRFVDRKFTPLSYWYNH